MAMKKIFENLFVRIGAVFLLVFVCVGLFIFASKNNLSEYLAHFNRDYRVYAVPIRSMDFAGEAVPLNDFEVRERLDKEVLVNVYWQSATMQSIKRANRFFLEIEPILKQEGIPADFKYLAVIESGLLNVVSPSGAAGFWQIMRETGKQYNLEITDEVDERYHCQKATLVACRYFKDAYRKFGNWTMVAASYNAGITGMSRAVTEQQDTNYYNLWLNTETSRYVMRILAIKAILQNPKAYGFYFRQEDLYKPLKTSTFTTDTSIVSLVAFARNKGITYKHLKICNPWLRGNSLRVAAGKSYALQLPSPSDVVSDKVEQEAFVPEFIQNEPDSVPIKRK